jgi:ligand-binding sensor domain-containing protein
MQKVEGNVTRFERLGLEHGLSQGCVNAVLQDSQGFLWIGTQDGLNKYDGYTFIAYRHDPTDPTSISTNVIHALLEDSEGDLWLGTDRGLVRLDKRSEVFTPPSCQIRRIVRTWLRRSSSPSLRTRQACCGSGWEDGASTNSIDRQES